MVEPHARRQQAEDLGVGLALADGCDGRTAEAQVEVPVGLVQVVVLEGRGRGQHDVREVDGVRLEEVVHDDEEVLAREARVHAPLVGRDRGRVGVVDVERLHRRVERGIERAGPASLMLSVRVPGAHQVGPLERRVVDGERARGREQQAAARRVARRR